MIISKSSFNIVGKGDFCDIPFFLTNDKYLQEIKKLIVSDVKCPMLGGEIEPNLLKLLDDPIDYLKSIKVVEGVINN